jgi:hypothetical protein
VLTPNDLSTLVTCTYLLLFFFLIKKIPFFHLPASSKWLVPGVFLLKVGCGLFLNWVYSHYYPDRSTADVFKYFDDSLVLHQAFYSNTGDFFQMLFGIFNDSEYFNSHYYARMNHWMRPFGNNYYNDTHLLIRFNAVLRFFSFGYIGVHTVFANLISITGIVLFYTTFKSLIPVAHSKTLYVLFFLPSLLFWGSGVLKEGFLLFALGLLLMAFFNLIHQRFKLKWLMVFLTMIYLILRLKFYVLVALLPAMMAYTWVTFSSSGKTTAKYLITSLLVMGIGLNLKHLHTSFDILTIIRQKQLDFICLAEYMNSGSSIALTPLEPTTIGFINALPQSLYNGFIRPGVWESNSAFTLFSALENTALVVFILCTWVIRKKEPLQLNLLFFCITFIVVLNTLIGLTTPVLGAVVRYRVPALPFYIVMLSLWFKPTFFNQKTFFKIK